jgi:hypothetical protein
MKYLIETTEVYRVDTEDECRAIVEDAKKSSLVSKYSAVKKERKQKGEVIDEWYKLSITKKWTDEKEPDTTVTINYNSYAGVFPSPKVEDDMEDEE